LPLQDFLIDTILLVFSEDTWDWRFRDRKVLLGCKWWCICI